jgi:hypothetical protein
MAANARRHDELVVMDRRVEFGELSMGIQRPMDLNAATTEVARAFQPVKIVRELVSSFTRWKACATPQSSQT